MTPGTLPAWGRTTWTTTGGWTGTGRRTRRAEGVSVKCWYLIVLGPFQAFGSSGKGGSLGFQACRCPCMFSDAYVRCGRRVKVHARSAVLVSFGTRRQVVYVSCDLTCYIQGM